MRYNFNCLISPLAGDLMWKTSLCPHLPVNSGEKTEKFCIFVRLTNRRE
jgi:hypothetical protein